LSVIISVRVPKWVKEKLEKYNVNIAELVRRKLIEEIERLEEEELRKELDELAKSLAGKIDPYEIARIIDEDRKNRWGVCMLLMQVY